MENPKQKNPGFLCKKYRDLNSSREVDVTAKVAARGRIRSTLSEENAGVNPAGQRIQSYLDWLTQRVSPVDAKGLPDTQRRERNIAQLKKSLHREHVIKSGEIPEGYFNSIKRKHRAEDHGDIETPADYRRELTETIITDQIRSLDNWIDYLASDDAKYPDWLKYFAMRNVVRMGRYDKQKKSFTERTGGAIAAFPDLNREALAIVLEAFERQAVSQSPKFGYDIAEDTKQQFLQFLQQKNFAKLYALAIEEFKPISEELLQITEGEWRTYPRGSNPKALVESIAPYGTGWCIRDESMAERYLVRDKCELQVFYSNDLEGKPTVPRLVTVVNSQNHLVEVRGIAPEENHDEYIGDVVQAKFTEFPDGKQYEKKAADMKQLTVLEAKVKAKQELTRDDLTFLYELDSPIEGFGYRRDPRIAELRQTRNPEADMPIVFDCTLEHIARSPDEITAETKAYVGELTPGIFEKLKSVEHIYTAFPEKKIRKIKLELPGMTGEEWIAELNKEELKKLGIKVGSYAESMLWNPDFSGSRSEKRSGLRRLFKLKDIADLIRLTVADLGFPNDATTKDIYAKAEELGLELCPAEVGPALRKQYLNQPMNEWLCIAMTQIADSYGNPYVFQLHRNGGGLWLDDNWAKPDYRWNPDNSFVFRPRKF